MDIYLDIETIPAQPEEETKAEIEKSIKAPAAMKKPETIAEWHEGKGKYAGVKDALIEEQYLKTSFNGALGEVISIAYSVEGSKEIKSFSRSLDDQEWVMIDKAIQSLANDLQGMTPFFIGHNIPFDLKFLFHRCVILGIKPVRLPFDGCHGSQFYDTMQAWEGFKRMISQDKLCKYLGIEGKPDDIDGSKVWEYAKADRIGEIEAYNRDDVSKVIAIHNRLTFKVN
jgi:predicted PolB exonuclease-like 3'-5' exonuclease